MYTGKQDVIEMKYKQKLGIATLLLLIFIASVSMVSHPHNIPVKPPLLKKYDNINMVLNVKSRSDISNYYILSGYIRDSYNNTPVNNTFVDAQNEQNKSNPFMVETASNGTGYYNISVPSGYYNVTFISNGYNSKYENILINSNKMVNVSLIPTIPPNQAKSGSGPSGSGPFVSLGEITTLSLIAIIVLLLLVIIYISTKYTNHTNDFYDLRSDTVVKGSDLHHFYRKGSNANENEENAAPMGYEKSVHFHKSMQTSNTHYYDNQANIPTDGADASAIASIPTGISMEPKVNSKEVASKESLSRWLDNIGTDIDKDISRLESMLKDTEPVTSKGDNNSTQKTDEMDTENEHVNDGITLDKTPNLKEENTATTESTVDNTNLPVSSGDNDMNNSSNNSPVNDNNNPLNKKGGEDGKEVNQEQTDKSNGYGSVNEIPDLRNDNENLPHGQNINKTGAQQSYNNRHKKRKRR